MLINPKTSLSSRLWVRRLPSTPRRPRRALKCHAPSQHTRRRSTRGSSHDQRSRQKIYWCYNDDFFQSAAEDFAAGETSALPELFRAGCGQHWQCRKDSESVVALFPWQDPSAASCCVHLRLEYDLKRGSRGMYAHSSRCALCCL